MNQAAKTAQPIEPKLFEKYKAKIFEIRPNLEKIYEENQGIDLFTFNKKHIRENKNPIIRVREKEVRKAIVDKVTQVLGTRVAESVDKQLKGNDSVGTTQHFAPLGEIVLKYSLQDALPYFNTDHPNLQNVIILACALVSFSNSSSPRALQFHSLKDKRLLTLPFFGRAIDAQAVIFAERYTNEAIEEILKKLEEYRNLGDIDKEQYKKLKEIVMEIYASPHALSSKNFQDQVTVTNYHLFNKVFSEDGVERVPNFVFLAQEDIVISLILENHLKKKTTLHNLIFDPKMHDLIDKYLNDVSGAFSVDQKKGSVLFWHIPKDGSMRQQLWRKNSYLETDDKSYRVELTPQAIGRALRKEEITPSVMLTFIVLSFYYGLLLTGGFRQTYVLSLLLSQYIKMLEEYGDQEAIQACQDVITSNMILQSSLLYLEYPDGEYIPATALDILLNQEKQTPWSQIFEGYKKTPYPTIVCKAFPAVYDRFCPPEEREEKLEQITEEDIDLTTGFRDIVQPIVKL